MNPREPALIPALIPSLLKVARSIDEPPEDPVAAQAEVILTRAPALEHHDDYVARMAAAGDVAMQQRIRREYDRLLEAVEARHKANIGSLRKKLSTTRFWIFLVTCMCLGLQVRTCIADAQRADRWHAVVERLP